MTEDGSTVELKVKSSHKLTYNDIIRIIDQLLRLKVCHDISLMDMYGKLGFPGEQSNEYLWQTELIRIRRRPYESRNFYQKHFEKPADDAGLSSKMALSLFDAVADGFEKAIAEAAYELAEQGYGNADEIKNKVLLRGGYGHM